VIDPLGKLLAIEEIKQLKARYWRGVDSKDAALWRSVFTDDAIIDFRTEGGDPNRPLVEPDAFVAASLAKLVGVTTAHHGHVAEIEILSPDEARSIWPMEDNLWVDPKLSKMPFSHLRGFGHYHDTYRRTPNGWKIASTTLVRTKVETV
jgi:hypothetical protein